MTTPDPKLVEELERELRNAIAWRDESQTQLYDACLRVKRAREALNAVRVDRHLDEGFIAK